MVVITNHYFSGIIWCFNYPNGRFGYCAVYIYSILTIPEKIFNEVIIPFLGVIDNPIEREELYNLETKIIDKGEMKEEDRYVWSNNKLIILSSPSFKFEYMYKLYKTYEDLIYGVGKDLSLS